MLAFTIIITLIIAIITYFHRTFSYWKRRGVPYLEPKFPFGTAENPFTRKNSLGVSIKQQYQQLKNQGHKHGGLYLLTNPTYIPIDPEYVKLIMSKDFQYFTDRGTYYNEKKDPLSAHLFHIEGQKWRNLRAKLTPTFTSGKMKLLFQTLVACSNPLIDAMVEFHERKQPVDIKDILGCFTTDVIGSCAFGIECNSFKNSNNDFRRYGKKIFSAATKLQAIRNIIAFTNPKLGRTLGISMINPEASKFFVDAVKGTVDFREKSGVSRKDFMQILIDLKNNKVGEEDGGYKHDGRSLTIEELAAQAFVFFLAGFETSSTTMSFCLFELAMNPSIQERVKDEVNRVLEKHHGKLTYDAVMEMKYMSQVVDETLRKYPPASIIPRVCTEDYAIPNTDVTLEKGTRIMIPAMGLHHDPEFYPDPELFDPERFSDENKKEIRPFTYIPFGEGPRICIGLRFGLMQTKVGLAVMLKNFKFLVNQRTTVPLELDPFSIILTAKSGIWLDIEKAGNNLEKV